MKTINFKVNELVVVPLAKGLIIAAIAEGFNFVATSHLPLWVMPTSSSITDALF